MVRGSSALIWRKSELDNAARRDKERAVGTGLYRNVHQGIQHSPSPLDFRSISRSVLSPFLIHRPQRLAYPGTSPGKGAKEASHKRHCISIDPGLSIPLYHGDLASSMDSSAPSKAVRDKLPLVRGGEVVL